MIELLSARDMRVTHMLIIAFQQNAFGIAVSPDPSSLSTWKGRDQTSFYFLLCFRYLAHFSFIFISYFNLLEGDFTICEVSVTLTLK